VLNDRNQQLKRFDLVQFRQQDDEGVLLKQL